MKKYIIPILHLVIVSQVFSEQIAGTSANLTPPKGYALSDRFPGFTNTELGITIMVSDIPGPYAQVTAGFNDSSTMLSQGMKVVSRATTKINGYPAMILEVEQSVYGTTVKKQVLAVDRQDETTLIVATYPEDVAKIVEEEIKTSLRSVTLAKPKAPSDALKFVTTPVPPFKVAKIFGQNMLLSANGQFPVENEESPIMLLGLSVSKNPLTSDQIKFAEHRIRQTAAATDIEIIESKPTKIGELSGFTTMATARGNDEGIPLTIYQVVLFDPSGYCLIQGITPSSLEDSYLPIFRKIAESFKLK